ncbi:MAG: PAS domain S-box protein [Thermomicrobiales bacterium]
MTATYDRANAPPVDEMQYRLLFEAHPEPMFIYDAASLAILAVNEAAISRYGYSRAEFLKMNGRDTRPAEDIDRYLAFAAHQEPYQRAGLWRHRTKDGAIFDADVTTTEIAFMGRPARLCVAIDVTEQQRAKAAIEASEGRFRALVEKSSDAIALVDAEGAMLYIGPSTERILGYRPEELIGTNSFAFIHPEDRERAAAVMGAILDTPGASASAQYRIRRKDGSWLWMEGTGTNHLDDPAIGAIVGNYRDISERKGAEETLKESEERFRALVERSWDAVAVLGVDGAVRYISPSATRIIGYLPDEIIGRALDDLFHPADQAGRADRGAVLVNGGLGATVASEMRVRHKDGGWRWLEIVTTNLLEDPAVRGFVSNFRDITERKQAEETLRLAETRYRSLVEQIPAIVYLADATRSSLLYTSPQREAMLGYAPEEWTAEPRLWEKVVHPDDLERVRAEDTRAIASGEPETVEYRYVAKDGHVVWVRDEAVLIRDGDGEPLYWQGVVVDITERKRAEEELRERERQLAAQFQGNPVPMYTWQRQGEDWALTGYNRAADAITHGTVARIVGATLGEVYGDRPEIHESFVRCAAGEERVDHEMEYTFRPTGERKDLCVTYVLVAPDLILVHTEDVTERKIAEEALRQSEGRYRSLIELSPEPILVHSDERHIFANAAAVRLLGATAVGDLIGGAVCDTIPPEFHAQAQQLMRIGYTERRPIGPVDVAILRLDGAVAQVELHNIPIVYDGEAATLTVLHDITERKRAEEELRHLASHDPLTDLPNRALLMRELASAVAHARLDPTARYAVLLLDLDRFKHANDSFGHVEGDQLLVAIAQRLHACLPERAIIARLAGDEFVVLLRELGGAGGAVAVAQRIHTVLDPPFAVRGQEIFITASIGIAPGNGYTHPDDILRDADAAMYRAKALGKARHVVFDAAMLKDARTVVQRERALRRAVERGEFAAFYQPIVALDTGDIIGFEALARWPHPDLGYIPPDEFIQLAEETGLIVAIDRWMLREACGQLRRWDKRCPEGPRLGMGVNVSGMHLAQADFVARVEEVLRETGLDPPRLRLEITESTLVAHTEVAASALCRLRDLGVRIALDDFGVGYSSLNYLREFPIDTVKIDRSFVGGAADDATSTAIVQSVVSLARTLGMHTVAEGIECGDQIQRLREIGCDYGQGYFFARPMPATEAERYLDATWSTQEHGKVNSMT